MLETILEELKRLCWGKTSQQAKRLRPLAEYDPAAAWEAHACPFPAARNSTLLAPLPQALRTLDSWTGSLQIITALELDLARRQYPAIANLRLLPQMSFHVLIAHSTRTNSAC